MLAPGMSPAVLAIAPLVCVINSRGQVRFARVWGLGVVGGIIATTIGLAVTYGGGTQYGYIPAIIFGVMVGGRRAVVPPNTVSEAPKECRGMGGTK